MPKPVEEVYRLILQRSFVPELRKEKGKLILYLYNPGHTYFVKYELANNKIKFAGGVMPERVI